MKIEAKHEVQGDPSIGIQVTVSGTPGDRKQPLSFIYTSFTLTPAAAKRLSAQLTKLTGGAV